MIWALMPSPIGHALAGVAAAWGADLVPGNRAWRTAPPAASWYRRAGDGMTLTCVALAVAPDLDLAYSEYHRSVTHSVTAVAAVGLIAALVARRMRRPSGAVGRVAAMCAGAWATHLLLDWLGVDRLYFPYGIQLFWPFDRRWFISGLDIFAGTERHNILGAAAIKQNAAAIGREILLLLPIVLAVWLIRVKALAGLSSELARGDHPPK
jgi:membrane-bound metal-dependent hydrolase YbcI (DUF457 family)